MSKITVFTARRVVTMDPGRPVAEAIAVMGGKVVSTGTLETMKPWLSRHEHTIDRTLEGKVILPGLIDPHTHFTMSAGYLMLHYIGPIDSPGPKGINPALLTHEQVIAKLRAAHAEEKDPKKPLIAWGLDPAIQGGHLHRDELDAISKDRPMWVISYAPHFFYLNSAAISYTGIKQDTTVHGVERYPDGRLKGVFVEIEAGRMALGGMRLVIQKGGWINGLRMMGETAKRAGVTTTAEMVFGFNDFELEWKMHVDAVNEDAFPLRMALVPLENPLFKTHAAKSADFLLGMAKERNNDKLFLHGIKFLSDGSFPAMSLRLNFPGYLDGGNGLRNDVPWDELPARMLPFWKAGIQIHCHANGDEAIDASLNALARLQEMHPRFDHRFTIEHYCISTPDQARRLKALGGCASVNNYFVHYRSLLHSDQAFGPDRSEAVGRLGSLDGILAVVDAETAERVASDPACAATFASQISAADLVILNKTDLVDTDALANAHALMGRLAPGKPVIETKQADVPTDVVLGIRSEREIPDGPPVSTDHAAGFGSWSASIDGVLDAQKIRVMLRELPAGVLRAKGVLRLSDAPDRRTVFQQVGTRFSYVTEQAAAETRISSLVVIGPAGTVDANALSRRFEACRT